MTDALVRAQEQAEKLRGSEMSLQDKTELLMLREFFRFWCELHDTPVGKDSRKKQEQAAAENMVRAARAVKRYRGVPLNG